MKYAEALEAKQKSLLETLDFKIQQYPLPAPFAKIRDIVKGIEIPSCKHTTDSNVKLEEKCRLAKETLIVQTETLKNQVIAHIQIKIKDLKNEVKQLDKNYRDEVKDYGSMDNILVGKSPKKLK